MLEAAQIDYTKKFSSVQNAELAARLGANLRAIRLDRGWSLSELSRAIGTTYQQIQKYEVGHNTLSPIAMVKFCEVLKCNLNDIFEGIIGPKVYKGGNPLSMLTSADIAALRIAQAIVDPTQKAAWLALGRTLATKTDERD